MVNGETGFRYFISIRVNEAFTYEVHNCSSFERLQNLKQVLTEEIDRMGSKPRFVAMHELLPGYFEPGEVGLLYPVVGSVRNLGFILLLNVKDCTPRELALIMTLLKGFADFAGSVYTSLNGGEITTEIVEAAIEAIEAKDLYTRGHSSQVAHYARHIAAVLGFSPQELEMIRYSALLHDIGKIGIQEQVLTKPGPLTDREWEQIRTHPEVGEQILKPLKLLAPVLAGVRSHHERYDGSGYPDGLKGVEIPLQARIIAVADAFDAMTSDRAYRKALPREVAVRELQKGVGLQFDPEVVKAFLEVLGKEGL